MAEEPPIFNTQERITNFASSILINEDASLTITEVIRVYANAEEIKRGIYRDFPTKYKDTNGLNYRTTFEVLEVKRDDLAEDWHTEPLTNGTRLYIGNSAVYLDPGYYTYTIKYTTNGQIGYFDSHDELYFNVTGNGWSFPIESVLTTVQLPNGVETNTIKTQAYTGYSGEQKTDYVANSYSDLAGVRYVSFKTLNALQPKEGLTIVVGWPKGLIYQPTQLQRMATLAVQNIVPMVGLFLLFLIFSYYAIVWTKYGRDPENSDPIIVRFGIDGNISPAAVRYIHKMGFDKQTMTAALVSMAVKGYLKIKEAKKEFTIELVAPDKTRLSDDEKALAEVLFKSDATEFKFKNTNASKVSKAITAMKVTLEQNYLNTYFKLNRNFLIIPVVINLLFLTLVSFGHPESLFFVFWLAIWSVGVVAMLVSFGKPFFDSLRSRISFKPEIVAGVLFSIPFVVAEIVVLGIFANSVGLFSATIIFMMFILNIFGSYAMKARTPLGRKVENEILGLKQYLVAVESPRYQSKINYETPDNLKVYEKYLPFAIALDVEPLWTGRFKTQISEAQLTDSEGLRSYNDLGFYSGAKGLTGALSTGFTSAISASANPPGSSSGFGGSGGSGGSSGGGGGGGGGGGW